MPSRTPSVEDLAVIAAEAGFDLDPEELEAYRPLVAAVLADFDAVTDRPDPGRPADGQDRTERAPGERPAPEADPHNLWITRCHVEGAATGPLAGMSVGLKDNIAVAGVEMTCGSRLLEGYRPETDATVVKRVLDAGASVVGKCNMESFSFSSTGTFSDFGPVRNPRAPAYTPGGSSSGSAAAVAAGAVDLALGCDQGGSIRMPAACCGVVGLKPTTGLIPYTGIFPIEPTIDHVGPIADSVRACARATDVLAGSDGHDARQPDGLAPGDYAGAAEGGAEDFTVGLLAEGFRADEYDPAVAETVRRAAESVTARGGTVEEVGLEMHREGPELWSAIGGFGGIRLLAMGGAGLFRDERHDTERTRRFDRRRRAGAAAFPATVKAMWLAAEHHRRTAGPAVYGAARNRVVELRQGYDDRLADVDVLAMPTVPTVPLEHTPEADPLERIPTAGLVPMGQNTCPFNLTSHPAITLPCGEVDGAPAGLMLVGRRFDEETLIGIAAEAETAIANGE